MVKNHRIAIIGIFKSIDGEAFHAGQPTVFVRTMFCNLRCLYPCDTPECWTEDIFYKVYKDEPERHIEWLTAQDIFQRVEDLEKDFDYKSICLTGGEPLLEDNKDFMLNELIPLFIDHDYAVNIETNGSIDYRPYKEKFGDPIILDPYGNRKGVTIIADYKLPCSGETSHMLSSNLALYSPYDIIKCVISDSEEDWKAFENLCKSGTKAKFYLSPCFGKVTMPRIPEFVYSHPQCHITAQIQEHKYFWSPQAKDV